MKSRYKVILTVLVLIFTFPLIVSASNSSILGKVLGWGERYSSYEYNKSETDSSKPYWYSVFYNMTNAGPKLKKQVIGFTTYYSKTDTNSYNSLIKNYSLINQIATHTFFTDGYGNINGLVPTSQLSYADKKGVLQLSMVSNNFDKSISKTLLESASNRNRLITSLLAQIKSQGYNGINIDIENISPSNRNQFTQLVKDAYNLFHPMGYTVTVSVAAKNRDNTNDGWNGAYDYREIGKYSDKVIIMAYDEHHAGGTPGPIASIGWFQNVANYAVKEIPREKIIMGIAAYGYDWSSCQGQSYGTSQMYNIAKKYNAQILFDDKSKAPYFNYTDTKGLKHSVWFENSTSLSYKLDVVNNTNLGGIAIWKIGLEDSSYWNVIGNKLKK